MLVPTLELCRQLTDGQGARLSQPGFQNLPEKKNLAGSCHHRFGDRRNVNQGLCDGIEAEAKNWTVCDSGQAAVQLRLSEGQVSRRGLVLSALLKATNGFAERGALSWSTSRIHSL